MITIISSTNRKGSNTLKVASHYLQLLEAEGGTAQLLDLSELPETFAFSELYGNRSKGFEQILTQYIEGAEAFVFVIPEYNGGFPGFLKLFVDAIPPSAFNHKKAGVVGLSSGHTGALRGLDHFSNILEYLKVDVIHNRPKLSAIESVLDENGSVADERALAQLKVHVGRMVGE